MAAPKGLRFLLYIYKGEHRQRQRHLEEFKVSMTNSLNLNPSM